MPEEVRFFARSAVFALVVSAIYWFASYEPAGTVLLFAFGVAGVLGAALLWRDAWARGETSGDRPWRWAALSSPDQPSAFTDVEARLPGPTLVPLMAAAAVALLMLGLVFGPALVVVALIPGFVAVRRWISASSAELTALERSEEGVEARPAPRQGTRPVSGAPPSGAPQAGAGRS